MTGLIVKVFGRYYTVGFEEKFINCVLRGKIKRDKVLKKYSAPVAAGDLVEFEILEDGSGVIESIHKRRNAFSRKDKIQGKEDIIAANIDSIIVVQSFSDPQFNLRFADRLLVRAEKEDIPLLLCVNKLDLAFEDEPDYIKSYYKASGIDTIFVSAETGENLNALKKYINGKLSVFTGNSGVGKTSILNSILSGINLRTSEVSLSTGKGRHTTTNVEIIRYNENTSIIDTPGMREFGLSDIEPEELALYFSEFRKYSGDCNFNPCTHDHEPKCEVKKRVEKGDINEERYISYLNMLYSLKEDYARRY